MSLLSGLFRSIGNMLDKAYGRPAALRPAPVPAKTTSRTRPGRGNNRPRP